ncbi:flagellar biosynthetic protein FliO [Nocardioides mangrovi]|uniref:Flagellar biosynthetic protein FliO n=1 Tax=Nocardioides mangrovi TaxID=2874580 RepID=A0ABS7UAF9_9ACTN|nr:flagellar biosynthetic protein FliO [Nocardioides mangrovi]MBZ5737825.1 flagellar biosynthetic protein FliO [Nocardioides mangrovi]
MLELTIRLVFSLAVVLGLLALLARFGGRKFAGRRDAMIRVVHRQAISRGTAVSVVAVGSRVLVLGTTEHQVRVLAELDPEEIEEADVLSLVPGEVETAESATQPLAIAPAEPVRGSHRAATPAGGRRKAPQGATGGALSGSVLSTDTWRQALAAATRRAS